MDPSRGAFDMNEQTVKLVCDEIAPVLEGRRFGRVFMLDRNSLAIDFRPGDGRFLFVSVAPHSPRIYLISRKLKDLEKASGPETVFTAALRKQAGNAIVRSLSKLEGERVVLMELETVPDLGESSSLSLAIQLTGRSANLFMLDSDGVILDAMRPAIGPGRQAGDHYTPPQRSDKQLADQPAFDRVGYSTLSEALDEYFRRKEESRKAEESFRNAEGSLKNEIRKKARLSKALASDLEEHGDPEIWKRFGDLLLANASSAKREGDAFRVTDYFSEGAPEISIPADPRHSVSEAAEQYFKKYSKARNARKAIARRLEVISSEVQKVEKKLDLLREAHAKGDADSVESFLPEKKEPASSNKAGKKDDYSGVRRFLSGDGFEILVGKKSKDNDYLTFRIANSLDTWMHAADYPGSHVVVRNPQRLEIPPSTLAEAASVAAFYSKAKGESKAAVHYTLRKFVHKPRGAKPGLVSLSDFKTIMVEPGIPLSVLRA